MTELERLDGYFRAANYISACQLYLLDNPLLKRPLKASDIKKKIVGHWGTVPGQNFIYTHLDRVINKYDLDMIYISGPGHGGNFMIANTYLEGSYTEKYPNITQDEAGLQKLFKQFSFPGGVPSHVAPETPGSIHEGGELGYSLSHAFGAVFDNPNLIAACVVGDGEAETGPLATSWHGIKFLNKKTDGAVLPILHLNGYKISNPTIFSRMSNEELASFFYGCGYKAYLVEGSDELLMHKKMASTMDAVINDIKEIKKSNDDEKPRWPMIILRTPKGWTGPKEVDGKNIEGSFRAHQVPVSMDKKEHIKILEDWLRSYKPEELFDSNGKLKKEYESVCPKGDKRMGSSLYTNGGYLRKDLIMPDFRNYKVDVPYPGCSAVITSLSVSGLDTSSFAFYGFVPTENKAKKELFERIKHASVKTKVIYESPKRIIKLLEYIKKEIPGCVVSVCTELTKVHEHTIHGKIEEVYEKMKDDPNSLKGEYVVLINNEREKENESDVSVEALLVDLIIKNKCSLKEAIKLLNEENKDLSKKDIYNASLNLKNILKR